MVTTRYSDQQRDPKPDKKLCGSTSNGTDQISKRSIKPPYTISRATSIDSECCRLPTISVLSKKPEKLRSNQFCMINKSKFLKATHCAEIRKIRVQDSIIV